MFDPYHQNTVPIVDFEYRLDCFFKGQFKYKGEDEDKQRGMSEDIQRDLVSKGVTDDKGNLLIHKFRKGLESNEVDIEIFKRAMK